MAQNTPYCLGYNRNGNLGHIFYSLTANTIAITIIALNYIASIIIAVQEQLGRYYTLLWRILLQEQSPHKHPDIQ